MATDNPHWGEYSIRDRLADLGIAVSDRTVTAVLRRNGIPPAPQRSKGNDWQRFISSHWPHLAAIDFATFEVPSGNRTKRHHALYAMRVATREVRLLGVTEHADGGWTLNRLREAAMCDVGFLNNMNVVIMDRDPLFTNLVKSRLASAGCQPKVLPPRSPNLNAYIERFIGTVRREIGRQIIPLSTAHLETTLHEHIGYHNHERNHQGLSGHPIPIPLRDREVNPAHPVQCRSRHGKTLNYYYRAAI